ncbi:DNA cytosine methyltransferase [Marinobacter alexandrii]|uniref:DNA cytosine methyltransferase n=1 Tax=Marinobacter alexandrii TaxID=2570351 RepID=UPI003297434C
MNHIELFAGCGGLSLGLETEGFELLLANELSPMAAETFSHNILNVTLENSKLAPSTPVYWISSACERHDLEGRLTENPENAVGLLGESDFKSLKLTAKELRGSLLVGSIVDLNTILTEDKELAQSIRRGFGDGGVDLVSGGPPCQSFSMAGLRQRSNPRNLLPLAFANFVQETNPKIALLENVSGILRPFRQDGKPDYAWHNVAKEFAERGFVPLCLHVNARYAGAAQNRPRFIMLAFREDFAHDLLRSKIDRHFWKALLDAHTFYVCVHDMKIEMEYGSLDCHEIEKDADIFSSPLLASLVEYKGKEFTVRDAIDDLKGEGIAASKYVELINGALGDRFGDVEGSIKNNRPPLNGNRVKSRFRLYQVLNKMRKSGRREVLSFIKDVGSTRMGVKEIAELGKAVSNATINELNEKDNWLLTLEGERFSPGSRRKTLSFLATLHTKKQTQKALVANQPAPAALSIPDDACHYDESLQRTLTVREMARFQSFPDGFEFMSKVTTGGQMRKFQVPQYTQVGNAVPPLLGKALGKVCRKLLEAVE